mgnify:FL=1
MSAFQGGFVYAGIYYQYTQNKYYGGVLYSYHRSHRQVFRP